MGERKIIHQAVKMRPLTKLDLALLRQEPQHGVGGRWNVAGPEDEFRTIAGRQHQNFLDAFRTYQVLRGLVTARLADPESLANAHRRRPEVQSDYRQCGFHRWVSFAKAFPLS